MKKDALLHQVKEVPDSTGFIGKKGELTYACRPVRST
jgi:hypothetical protein